MHDVRHWKTDYRNSRCVIYASKSLSCDKVRVRHMDECPVLLQKRCENCYKSGTHGWVLHYCNKNGVKNVTKTEHRNMFPNNHF